ncbi:MAG: substrate-binding domain-containing protein, partial [Actinomycetota bacterium]|nr:substrate-binding domain-containing protein [Actinomycetota bacterium]
MTTAQLTSIYNCTVTNWNQISGTLPSNTIQPYLPQVGSGTRKFFLTAIGLTDATVGACVNQTQEENNGSFLVGQPNRLAPYSIARWISQTPTVQG